MLPRLLESVGVAAWLPADCHLFFPFLTHLPLSGLFTAEDSRHAGIVTSSPEWKGAEWPSWALLNTAVSWDLQIRHRELGCRGSSCTPYPEQPSVSASDSSPLLRTQKPSLILVPSDCDFFSMCMKNLVERMYVCHLLVWCLWNSEEDIYLQLDL